jgi:putative hydrolase of the HAD superfamily
VLGSNGWDSSVRRRICDRFNIDLHETEERHRLNFDTFERGFTSFKKYLTHVFFAAPRDFTVKEVLEYAYTLSEPWPQNLAFYRQLKATNPGLKIGLISNEGEGLTTHRAGKFGLREVADFMVFSYGTHLRKPDPAIWHLALSLAQVTPENSIYVDDRAMFVQVAAELGFTALHYTSLAELQQNLSELGLAME